VCVCVCVCVSLCASVRVHISGSTQLTSPNFICLMSVTETLPSSGGVVIPYVLPVLWMTDVMFSYNASWDGLAVVCGLTSLLCRRQDSTSPSCKGCWGEYAMHHCLVVLLSMMMVMRCWLQQQQEMLNLKKSLSAMFS